MTIYFRNYTEKIRVVCQNKTGFVFNVARQCLHRRHSWDLPRACKPFAMHIRFSSSECRERHFFYCLGRPQPKELQRFSQLLPRKLRESSGFLMTTLKLNQTNPQTCPQHKVLCKGLVRGGIVLQLDTREQCWKGNRKQQWHQHGKGSN